MQKLYELKTDEAGNEYIEWEYAGDKFKVVKFADKFKFLKRFENGEQFQVFDSIPSTNGKKELDWDTAFYYGTIIMETTAFERMLQISEYYKSLSHVPALTEEWTSEKREPILPRPVARRATLEILVGSALLAVLGVIAYLCY